MKRPFQNFARPTEEQLPASAFHNDKMVYFKSVNSTQHTSSSSSKTSKPLSLEITFGKQMETMNPVRQKLLFECHSIFCKTQSVALASKGELRVDDAMILSQRYRLAIRNAVRLADQVDLPQVQKQEIVDDLLSTEVIWSLFEAVSIRPTNHSIVVDLVEWGRECFSSAADVLATVMEDIADMQTNEKPERHDLYWNALIQQVLSGDFKSACNLLKFHSKYETDGSFQRMAMIFQKIDIGLCRDRTNCDDFVEGQREIRELIQTGLLRQHDNLNFIYAILRGQKVAFMKCSQTLAINWYELLPAYVLFCHPAAKPQQIGKIAEDLFSFTEKSKDDLPVLEKTLFSILSLDCLEALRQICLCGSTSWWFATHLIDLLYYHDPSVLGADVFSSGSQMGLRTRILVEYASSLFSTKELWEIAADYLMASGTEEVVQMLEERVAELDWQGNTRLAERIISMCCKYDLINAKNDLTRAVTMRFLREKEWSTCLGWALRNGSQELLSEVAQKVLVNAEPDCIAQMRIFDAMSDAFLTTPELVLLYKFYTFKRHSVRGELKEAVADLHQLFIDNSSQAEFHVVLFDEMIKMLNATLGNGGDIELPSLDKNAILDMYRAVSMFEYFQRIRLEGDPPPKTVNLDLKVKIEELLQTLVPMLGAALAASTLS